MDQASCWLDVCCRLYIWHLEIEMCPGSQPNHFLADAAAAATTTTTTPPPPPPAAAAAAAAAIATTPQR